MQSTRIHNSCKDTKKISFTHIKSEFFSQRILNKNRPFAVSLNTTNTYIKNLQEKRKGTLKNNPAADSSAARLAFAGSFLLSRWGQDNL
jgi:hypothetical protein